MITVSLCPGLAGARTDLTAQPVLLGAARYFAETFRWMSETLPQALGWSATLWREKPQPWRQRLSAHQTMPLATQQLLPALLLLLPATPRRPASRVALLLLALTPLWLLLPVMPSSSRMASQAAAAPPPLPPWIPPVPQGGKSISRLTQQLLLLPLLLLAQLPLPAQSSRLTAL